MEKASFHISLSKYSKRLQLKYRWAFAYWLCVVKFVFSKISINGSGLVMYYFFNILYKAFILFIYSFPEDIHTY